MRMMRMKKKVVKVEFSLFVMCYECALMCGVLEIHVCVSVGLNICIYVLAG